MYSVTKYQAWTRTQMQSYSLVHICIASLHAYSTDAWSLHGMGVVPSMQRVVELCRPLSKRMTRRTEHGYINALVPQPRTGAAGIARRTAGKVAGVRGKGSAPSPWSVLKPC